MAKYAKKAVFVPKNTNPQLRVATKKSPLYLSIKG